MGRARGDRGSRPVEPRRTPTILGTESLKVDYQQKRTDMTPPWVYTFVEY